MALSSDITKVFSLNKFSPAVANRINDYRNLSKGGNLLSTMIPWITIADSDYTILFSSANRPSQLQSPSFLGNIEVVGFSTENDNSTVFLSTGNLRVRVLNREIVNNGAAPFQIENKFFNRLMSLGQEIIIIVGQSDITPPLNSAAVVNIVNKFENTINKGYTSLTEDSLLVKQMVFRYHIVEPSMTLESDSTISMNIKLMGSTTVYLKSITISDNELTELFNSAVKKTVNNALSSTIPFKPSIISSIIQPSTPFNLTTYNGSDFLNSINDLEKDFKNNDVFEYLKKIIYKLPIDQTELSFSSTTQCDSLIKFGDFIRYINDRLVGIYNDQIINLQFKIESYQKNTPIETTNSELLPSIRNYVLSINDNTVVYETNKNIITQNNDPLSDTSVFSTSQYNVKTIGTKTQFTNTIRNTLISQIDANPSNDPTVRLEDVLIPLELLRMGKDETKTNNTTSLSVYLSRVIERINTFYEEDKFILEVREEGNTFVFFERKTHEANVNQKSLEDNQYFSFKLFEDQGIILNHSIDLALPSNELQGVLLSKDYVSPNIISKKLTHSQITDYANYLTDPNISSEIRQIAKFSKDNSKISNTDISTSMILTSNQVFQIWHASGRDMKKMLEDKNTKELVQKYCKDIIVFVFRNCYSGGKWLDNEISGAKNLIEKTKKIITFMQSDPLYNLFLSAMFTGTITIPGTGNLWQYQTFSLETGIKTYDLMQGILSEGKNKLFHHYISGVSHDITPTKWTTTISFAKVAYGQQFSGK